MWKNMYVVARCMKYWYSEWVDFTPPTSPCKKSQKEAALFRRIKNYLPTNVKHKLELHSMCSNPSIPQQTQACRSTPLLPYLDHQLCQTFPPAPISTWFMAAWEAKFKVQQFGEITFTNRESSKSGRGRLTTTTETHKLYKVQPHSLQSLCCWTRRRFGRKTSTYISNHRVSTAPNLWIQVTDHSVQN